MMAGIILTIGVFLWSLFIMALALIIGYGFPAFIWRNLLFNQCVNFKQHPKFLEWADNDLYEPSTNILYVMNITNINEFLKGNESIKLKLVGPMIFQETYQKTNIVFDQEAVSYLNVANTSVQRNSTIFNLDEKVNIGNINMETYFAVLYQMIIKNLLSTYENQQNKNDSAKFQNHTITIKGDASLDVKIPMKIIDSCYPQTFQLNSMEKEWLEEDLKSIFCFKKETLNSNSFQLIFPRWKEVKPDILWLNLISDTWAKYLSQYGNTIKIYCKDLENVVFDQYAIYKVLKYIQIDLRCAFMLSLLKQDLSRSSINMEIYNILSNNCDPDNEATCINLYMNDEFVKEMYNRTLNLDMSTEINLLVNNMNSQPKNVYYKEVYIRNLPYEFQSHIYKPEKNINGVVANKYADILDITRNQSNLLNVFIHDPYLQNIYQKPIMTTYTCLRDRNASNNGLWKSFGNMVNIHTIDTNGQQTRRQISGYTNYFPFPKYKVCMKFKEHLHSFYEKYIPEVGLTLNYTYLGETKIYGAVVLIYEAQPKKSYALCKMWNNLARIWIDFNISQIGNFTANVKIKNRIYIEPMSGVLWKMELYYGKKLEIVRKNVMIPVYTKYSYFQIKPKYADHIQKRVIQLLKKCCNLYFFLLLISILLMTTSFYLILKTLKHTKIFPFENN